MIIFTSNINLIGMIENPIVLNLSSYYGGYVDISNLITTIAKIPNNTGMPINEYIYSPTFDINFANMVINDNLLFISFMTIITGCYNGNNVVILVNRDEYRDAVMESLIKLIQIRYGYNCWVIETMEDLETAKESNFSPAGIMSINNDIFRLMQLNVSNLNVDDN